MQIIGVMSGSSLDGIDLACVDFSRQDEVPHWSLVAAEVFELSKDTKSRLASLKHQNPFEIARTEQLFTNDIIQAVNTFRKRHAVESHHLSVHGHTVLHDTNIQKSWQLLNPGLLSSKCGMDVIHDFRSQDMALGGQGTPMAVIADRDLFPGHAAYINLGGIANISLVKDSDWMAYDLAPFNQVFNYFAQKCDLEMDMDGNLAAGGTMDERVFRFLKNHSYPSMRAPKSLDNTEVLNEWILPLDSLEAPSVDILHSYSIFMTGLVDKEIADIKGSVMMTGGGVKNKFFMEMLGKKLVGGPAVYIPEKEIIDFKEAILMAYMAYLRLEGRHNFIARASGAAKNVSAGGHYKFIKS